MFFSYQFRWLFHELLSYYALVKHPPETQSTFIFIYLCVVICCCFFSVHCCVGRHHRRHYTATMNGKQILRGYISTRRLCIIQQNIKYLCILYYMKQCTQMIMQYLLSRVQDHFRRFFSLVVIITRQFICSSTMDDDANKGGNKDALIYV